ncbi:MAG TPA: antibiotic biosynthesis monooxygenase [Candidatus Nanoarchaeia archaeon]|nr:antibiotic biosynthesis monooxygenase [Candidatus Nanoarchaeia archaeon]
MKFIFEIKLKKGHAQKQYIDAWKKGSAIIQKSGGAQGTTLYQNRDDPTSLLAIATWKSKKERDAALKRLHSARLKIQEVIISHRKYGEIDILGNFEEIAAVKPDRKK